jgi:hypothetical protein
VAIPELYPNNASPKLPKAHVAYSNGAPLNGYLAVTFLGLSFLSSQPCCSATCAATACERPLMAALCAVAEVLLTLMASIKETRIQVKNQLIDAE